MREAKRVHREDDIKQENFRVSGPMDQNKSLPIYSKGDEIMSTVGASKVTIVCGDTGCGKTTQVPQYVLQTDSNAKIICTQPRRLAAINIAKRVATELGEAVGYTVGYHVGMANGFHSETKILFMTTGIFLQRLVNDPEYMNTITHVILDEVHERDVDIDFTMVILKHLLGTAKYKFKVVLMSATINTELFSHYFAKEAIEEVLKLQAYNNKKLKDLQERDKNGEKMLTAGTWGFDSWGDGDEGQTEEESKYKKTVQMQWGYVDEKADNDEMPVQKKETPAPVVNLNKQIHQIEIYYLDYVLQGIQKMLHIPKTDPIFEGNNALMSGARAGVMDETLGAATYLIVDLIELKNCFREKPGEKRTVLVFMPGMMEIF